jgi:hypothetical protein
MIGVTLCPGKKDRMAGWHRDLDADLAAIRAWDAETSSRMGGQLATAL